MHTYIRSAMEYGVLESELLGNRTKQLQKSPRNHEMSWFMSEVVFSQQKTLHRKAFLQKLVNTFLQLPRACSVCWKTMTVCYLSLRSSLVINICIWYFNPLSSKLTENHKTLHCRAFLSLRGEMRRIVSLRSATEVHSHVLPGDSYHLLIHCHSTENMTILLT